jgi:predicted Fe-Mo cluster-binding NifX family protein
MKVAVTAQHNNLKSPIDPHFGRAPFFVVVDTESGEFTTHDNAESSQAGHAAGIQAAAAVVSWDARAVITGNIGPKAFAALRAEHVKVYLVAVQKQLRRIS